MGISLLRSYVICDGKGNGKRCPLGQITIKLSLMTFDYVTFHKDNTISQNRDSGNQNGPNNNETCLISFG